MDVDSVPGAQFTQATEDVEPIAEDHVPFPHGAHDNADIAPTMLE